MISEVGGSKNPSKIIFFWHRFLHRFLVDFLVEKWTKIDPKSVRASHHFRSQNRPWRPRRILDPFWSPFRSLLAPFGSLFAPFGSFLVHFWLPLAPFWLPFGFFALSFACFWLAFGSRLLSFAIPSSPFCYFRLRAYKFFKKTGFIRHPRPQSTRFFHFCWFRKLAFVEISVHLPHASADRGNPNLQKPVPKATCGTLP